MTEIASNRLVVAVTGGIASGKSEVTRRFSQLGVPIVDLDLISKNVASDNHTAIAQIEAAFGSEVIKNDGSLNRRQIRQAIFSDPEKKKILESILHPIILKEALVEIESAVGDLVIVAYPLLAETGVPPWINRVLLVDVDEATQVKRLTGRDEISAEEAANTIASQASRKARLLIADDVITNDRSLAELREAVDVLHSKYKKLSQKAK